MPTAASPAETEPPKDADMPCAELVDASFVWSPAASEATTNVGGTTAAAAVALHGVSLQLRRGELVVVTGPVGAGKSALLRALAGTLAPVHGSARITPRVSVFLQPPWIMTASVRDNIVFGQPFRADTYAAVLQATRLNSDLSELPVRAGTTAWCEPASHR